MTLSPNAQGKTLGKPVSVCIVEDDDWLRRDLAREIGENKGFQCVGAYRTAEEALANVPGASADVVVMDINLPGLSGIECVRRLKSILPDLAVLMLTVYEESDQIFAALRAGASGYLLKRSTSDELLNAIGDLANGGSPMTSSVARKVVRFFAGQGRSDASVAGLTPREAEILDLITQGRAYKEIGDQLSISVNTVRMFIRRIYKKMHVHSRAEVAALVNEQRA